LDRQDLRVRQDPPDPRENRVSRDRRETPVPRENRVSRDLRAR
jgi:hypothetical protein